MATSDRELYPTCTSYLVRILVLPEYLTYLFHFPAGESYSWRHTHRCLLLRTGLTMRTNEGNNIYAVFCFCPYTQSLNQYACKLDRDGQSESERAQQLERWRERGRDGEKWESWRESESGREKGKEIVWITWYRN